MSPRFLHTCEVFQPAEKACWKILLDEQGEVARIPAAEIDAAIDRTLTQLWALLKTRSIEAWLRQAPPLRPQMPEGGDCAIHALLAYFSSGQQALGLIADEVALSHPRMSAAAREHARSDLDFAYKILVQRELQALCGSCSRYAFCRFSGKPEIGRPTRPVRVRGAKKTRVKGEERGTTKCRGRGEL